MSRDRVVPLPPSLIEAAKRRRTAEKEAARNRQRRLRSERREHRLPVIAEDPRQLMLFAQ
jgi:hypothetical protein